MSRAGPQALTGPLIGEPGPGDPRLAMSVLVCGLGLGFSGGQG